MEFKRILLRVLFGIVLLFVFTGCGDLEPDMQDTRTVNLNMDFHSKSSSRSSSSVSAAELSQYNTHLILALPSWEYLTSNYRIYYSSFAQELMNTADKKVGLEIPLNTQMKIFAFLFKDTYTLSDLISGYQEVGYYGESQPFYIDAQTNDLSLGINLIQVPGKDTDIDVEDTYDELEDDIVDPSLEAFYPFNGNAKDITDKYRDLTVYGDTSLTSGKDNSSNSAYYFDGTGDYLEYETNSDAGGTTIPSFDNYTISLWAKPASSGPYEAIFSSYNDSVRGFQIDFDGSNFHIRKSSGDNIVLSTAQLDVWTFIAFTYDGTNSIAYINNESPVSDAGGTTEFNLFRIGMNRAGGTYFTGAIDELRIYNRALTASEISSLYAN